MSNARFHALEESGRHAIGDSPQSSHLISLEYFGIQVFNERVMEQVLPKAVFHNIQDAISCRGRIRPEYADTIAIAMKEWAIGHGATHYTHWFHPLTGSAAEKHDAFLDWNEKGGVLEQFSGKQLLQGEPDASSFPSGGLRTTFEARGYTGWDPTSPVFLWKGGDGVTLCIPSVFISWTGEVLDTKIPLLRSDEAINKAVLRLLKLTGIKAERVCSNLGLEQEYFVIDRALRNLRPDLLLLGKTVFGAPSPKGQELQDHYLGSVKDRILAFMLDFEVEAIKLGIPVKTRHNEVAPAQHEVAPVFEPASKAVDHNILLMELMRHIAVKHQLSCLLHEKPFKGFNGSGKHSNWSLSTDTGLNLLDPTDTPGNNLHFLILITAVLHAVHRHSTLLRASIGSASNDYRLGGHEAPPAIISVYLGQGIEHVLDSIEEKGSHTIKWSKEIYDLGLSSIPDLKKDNTDRNRSSPFAFTGNKFEFRAVGSSANPAFPVTVINAIVAESVQAIVDDIENELQKKPSISNQEMIQTSIEVIRRYLKASKAIRYSGDNYSSVWMAEAMSRQLPNHETAIKAYEVLKLPATIACFKGILNEQELLSRYEIAQDNYRSNLLIEIALMLDIFRTQLLPVALQYQKMMAKCIQITQNLLDAKDVCRHQIDLFIRLNRLIEQSIESANFLEKSKQDTAGEQIDIFVSAVRPLMDTLRRYVDQLELIVDDQLWPLPKYRELLYII